MIGPNLLYPNAKMLRQLKSVPYHCKRLPKRKVFLVYICIFILKLCIAIGGITNREYKFRILIVNMNYRYIFEETVINEI